MFITETERTGPVVRVWVAGVAEEFAAREDGLEPWQLEDEALTIAKESLGTEALATIEYHMAADVFEVIFEAGDLA